MEAKENALSALFRFTDPTNIGSQRDLVKWGIYPLLVNFLNTGSVTAKARAAAFIGDLSMSTPKLTVVSKSTGCTRWWCFRPLKVPLCSAHESVCTVSSTLSVGSKCFARLDKAVTWGGSCKCSWSYTDSFHVGFGRLSPTGSSCVVYLGCWPNGQFFNIKSLLKFKFHSVQFLLFVYYSALFLLL